MFGYAAFAQSPFASLGGNSFAAFILENLTLADAQSAVKIQNVSIIEGTITETDINVGSSVYFKNITENLSAADLSTAAAIFAGLATETISLAEAITVLRTAYGSVSEAIAVLDGLVAGGWFKIDNSQTITWAALDNSQPSTWSTLDDSQPSNWVLIDDSQ
jgi:hypothetical protein